MRVYSTFTGAGGIDLGLERAGMQIVWQCESDPKCRIILEKHWPGIPCHDDIRTVRVESAAGGSADGRGSGAGDHGRADAGIVPAGIDMLCGGVPCQDWSVAGRRAGIGGGRSGLFFDFARIADLVVRPGGWLLFENVPGLFSSNDGRDFGIILATLAEGGFHDLAWRVLDSRYFGVPQGRKRVFIVARRSTGSSAKAVLLEPEGGGGDFEKVRQARARVAATLTSGAGSGRSNRPGRLQEDGVNIVITTFTRNDWDNNYEGQIVVGALDTGHGGPDDNDARANHLVVHATQDPISSADVCPAVTANAENGTNDSIGVRRLTPLERERLQGFPDGWTILPETLAKHPDDLNPPPDAHRNAMTGNAVTVPVAEWIGRRIMAEAAQ